MRLWMAQDAPQTLHMHLGVYRVPRVVLWLMVLFCAMSSYLACSAWLKVLVVSERLREYAEAFSALIIMHRELKEVFAYNLSSIALTGSFVKQEL